MKKIIISLVVIATMFCSTLGASAEKKIGFVDMSKILSNYVKAQEITSNVKDRQTEIQKMIAEAQNQVRFAPSDTERAELEKKLTTEIEQKNNLFRADYEKNVQDLQNNIIVTVKKIADSKKLDFVFKKDNIIMGGQDITDDVLAELNK